MACSEPLLSHSAGTVSYAHSINGIFSSLWNNPILTKLTRVVLIYSSPLLLPLVPSLGLPGPCPAPAELQEQGQPGQAQAKAQQAEGQQDVLKLQGFLSGRLRHPQEDGRVKLVLEPLAEDAGVLQLVDYPIQVLLPRGVLPVLYWT